MAYVPGTDDAETLRPLYSDTFYIFDALGGDDDVFGSEEVDYVFAGSGNDFVLGFGGDDYLWGDGDNDEIYGGKGNDQIYGGDGEDTLIGVDQSQWNGGQGEVDLLVGGSYYGDPSDPAISRDQARDKFLLGDGYEAFYMGNGNQDFAIIPDFEPLFDNIQLYGNADDYVIGGIPSDLSYNGIAFSSDSLGLYRFQGGFELVAVLQNVSFFDLDLRNSSQFTYQLEYSA